MKILLYFAHEHLEFRFQELRSIIQLMGVDIKEIQSFDNRKPFLMVKVQSEKQVVDVTRRSVLIRSAIEIWLEATSYNSLYDQLKHFDQNLLKNYIDKTKSFRIKVEAFNKQLTMDDKIQKIEQLMGGPIQFEGKINLKDDCDVTFYLLEYYERINGQSANTPSQVFFGRWICDSGREDIKNYALSKRKFIGNTSMDPTLSMIIANMAMVKKGSLVYDPFVGTGSLLVSCAHFGGYVMGSDIDYNVISSVGKSSRAGQKWRCKDETIRNNLKQYNLEDHFIDSFIADASMLNKLCRSSGNNTTPNNDQGLFDAIVTDPPYGIREPTTKLGFKKEPSENFIIKPEQKDGHIPCKKSYKFTEMLCDLLNFSARYLVAGGRLVFWMPIYRQDYSDANIPHHRCLKLVANSEQLLNSKVSRRLITMEKICNPEEIDVSENKDQITVAKDHYENFTFRERYFKQTSKT